MNNKKLFVVFLLNLKALFIYDQKIKPLLFLIEFFLGPIMFIIHELLHIFFSIITFTSFKLKIYSFMKVIGYSVVFNVKIFHSNDTKTLLGNLSNILIASGPLWIILIFPYFLGIKGLISLCFTFNYWFLSKQDIKMLKISTDNVIKILSKYLLIIKKIMYICVNKKI